jgi:Cyclin, N-terminal domain
LYPQQPQVEDPNNLEQPYYVDCLHGHNLKPRHRAQMIDWMIQVFRFLNRSTDRTFFIAVQILDRFFAAK